MPNIDHHAAVSTLRARYNVARRALERPRAANAPEGAPEAPEQPQARLEALDALQGALESLSPSTLSCTSWQDMARACFRLAFGPESAGNPARQLYAGGLLVYSHSTGVNWQGAWKDELVDAA